MTNKSSSQRSSGIITNKKCKCGCGEYIIQSFYRIKRGLKAPDYIHGHFGRISLVKFRFKKGHVPWDKGKKHNKKSIQKMSEARKQYYKEKRSTGCGETLQKRSKKNIKTVEYGFVKSTTTK